MCTKKASQPLVQYIARKHFLAQKFHFEILSFHIEPGGPRQKNMHCIDNERRSERVTSLSHTDPRTLRKNEDYLQILQRKA